MASPQRRLWDTSVIVDFLEGTERSKPHVPLIIEEAKRGDTEIMVSAFAEVEVVKPNGVLTEKQEEMIREFFSRPYVIRAQVDARVAAIARQITRMTSLASDMKTVKPKDAVHVATAVRWDVPVVECYDEPLIRASTRMRTEYPSVIKGVIVREPQYEGQARADELLDAAAPQNQ